LVSAKIVEPRIDESWLKVLKSEFDKDYFAELKKFLLEEKLNHTIFPPSSFIFRAFDSCPLGSVKVVILGQDPYHGPGQAHGLCFSVPANVQVPPSLKNIYKELNSDIGFRIPTSGNLEPWARAGVLLLNTTLTVRSGLAGSHQKKGWEVFTDAAISAVSANKDHVVFMLWGNHARSKKTLIDQKKHMVLEAAHPSPLSAYQGFLGCRHFSQCNTYLEKHGLAPIDWTLA